MIDFIERHMIFTIIIVFLLLGLTFVITVKVFFDPEDIPTGTATAFGVFFGLPALTIGLWKWRSDKTDKKSDK